MFFDQTISKHIQMYFGKKKAEYDNSFVSKCIFVKLF